MRASPCERLVTGRHRRGVAADRPPRLAPNKRHARGWRWRGSRFLLQQSLEKFLKASLVSRGQPLRKIHALQALLDAAVVNDPGAERFRPLCERVSGYYVLARYPGAGEAPEVEQIRQDLGEARNLILAFFPDEKLA